MYIYGVDTEGKTPHWKFQHLAHKMVEKWAVIKCFLVPRNLKRNGHICFPCSLFFDFSLSQLQSGDFLRLHVTFLHIFNLQAGLDWSLMWDSRSSASLVICIQTHCCSLDAVDCFTEITGSFCRKLCALCFTSSVCNNSVTSWKGWLDPQITCSAILLFVDVLDLQKLWDKFY